MKPRLFIDGAEVSIVNNLTMTRSAPEVLNTVSVHPADVAEPFTFTRRLELDADAARAYADRFLASPRRKGVELSLEADIPWPALWTRHTVGHRELRRDRRRRGLPEPADPFVGKVTARWPEVRFRKPDENGSIPVEVVRP